MSGRVLSLRQERDFTALQVMPRRSCVPRTRDVLKIKKPSHGYVVRLPSRRAEEVLAWVPASLDTYFYHND